MGFTSSLRKHIRKAVGKNKWAKVGYSAMGGSLWDTGLGIAEGDRSFRGSDIATAMSPYRTYNEANHEELNSEQRKIDRAEKLRQAGIENDVTGIRAQFGLFEGDPNKQGNHKALAEASAEGMAAAHDRYRQAYLQYFNPQLDEQFNDASRRATWAGIDRGNDGGSADQVRQRPILSRFVAGRQKIAAGADAGVEGLIDDEQAARLRLEDKARNGLAPEYAVQDELSGLGRSFNRASNAIAGETIGDFFGAGAGLYGDYQTGYGAAQGRRNAQRVSLFGDGSSGAQGAYT